jgi:hypothetical protein
MFDFMPGGPPKLEVIEESTPAPTPEDTPTPTLKPTAAPDTSDVKIVKVDAPTPNMAGPAEPVPTVIGMAKDNPLIAEGEPMSVAPPPDLSDTLSVQAVKGEPTPEPPVSSTVVEPTRPLGPPGPRRSSMKGGRAAEAAPAAPATATPESDVKVIKIDA